MADRITASMTVSHSVASRATSSTRLVPRLAATPAV
jgi:hypothetical protein